MYSLVCVLCDLDLARCSVALGSAGHIDRVTKETVAWHPTTNYASDHRTTVDANSHLKTGGREGEGK